MAYSRFRRRRLRRRRNPIRRRTITRTRRVRTRRPRRSMISRRRILNVSSTKKQDAMMPWSSNRNDTPSYTSGPILFDRTLSFNANRTMVFVPTARDRTIAGTSDPNSEARRTATSTYARGYAERVTISTNSGLPWRWRRIVFMFKGTSLIADNADQFYYERTTQGMSRLQIPTKTANDVTMDQTIFQGSLDVDWASRMDAPLDRTRIKVVSDVTRTFNPGNQTGTSRTFNTFYPINHTLIYNDDEYGNDTLDVYFSSTHPASCGDMYIVDYFSSMALPEPLLSGTSQIAVQCEGRYYWHER